MRFVGFVLLLGICYVWASDEWFRHSTYLGVEYVMNCTIDVPITDNTINWYRPTGEKIESGDKYVLNERLLKIKDVSDGDGGIYTCTVEGMDESFNQKHALNMAGPMYNTMTDKYYWNIVVGVVAGVAAGLLVIFLILLYHYRYKDPKLSRLQNDLYDDDYEMYNTHL